LLISSIIQTLNFTKLHVNNDFARTFHKGRILVFERGVAPLKAPVFTALSLTPGFSWVFAGVAGRNRLSGLSAHGKPLKRLAGLPFAEHPGKAGC
jgi:hypothetical protein